MTRANDARANDARERHDAPVRVSPRFFMSQGGGGGCES